MKGFILLALALSVGASFLLGCQSNKEARRKIDKDANSISVSDTMLLPDIVPPYLARTFDTSYVQAGDTFRLQLPSRLGQGRAWRLSPTQDTLPILDKTVLQTTEGKRRDYQVFSLRASNQADTLRLLFTNKRPFDPDTIAAPTHQQIIIIKSANSKENE